MLFLLEGSQSPLSNNITYVSIPSFTQHAILYSADYVMDIFYHSFDSTLYFITQTNVSSVSSKCIDSILKYNI